MIHVRNKRRLIPVLVALALPLLCCYQCGIGQGIQQTMVIGGDVTCLLMLVVFFVGIIFLCLLPTVGGGFGGGREA